MKCPACRGKGRIEALACSTGACRDYDMECSACKGTGETPEERVRILAEAERRRLDRIARGVSLREEARRLDVSATDLSNMEHGRAPFPEDA